MKKLKVILSAIALSLVLPLANVSATNEPINTLSATNNTSSIHVEGTTAALAVAIEVLEEDGTTSIVGPETTSVVSGAFSYDITGTFDTSKVYTVRAADYDNGTWKIIQTTAATTPASTTEGTSATSPNTGVAPKQSEITDSATADISLGVATATATAITYTTYLFNKRKAEQK